MTSSHTTNEPNKSEAQERSDQPDPEPMPSHESTVPLSNLSGRTLAHFKLGQQLGAGATSSVYQTTDTRTGSDVALKVLLPGADGVARSRFRQEANTAIQLDHPHIMRSYEVGETEPEGFAFIAMELVDGSSLAELLEQHRQISIVDSCLILEHVARGLDYAHRRGIVHRDVKPSNILLQKATDDTAGAIHLSMLEHAVVPLLSDFGIARALDAPELTTMGRTVGTPSYMAPEQCSGSHKIDGRADIYALGTVFYRCLVGRPPFLGSTTQILYAHVYNPLTIPDEVLVNLPMPVIDILRRSLAKDPGQRYATAAGMAIDMTRVTGGIQQPPPEGPVDLDEITATMTALPTADRTSSSTVLVPARSPSDDGGDADDVDAANTSAHRRGRNRTSQTRTGRELNRLTLGVGFALAALLVVIGIATVRFIQPTPDPVAGVVPNSDVDSALPDESKTTPPISGDEGSGQPSDETTGGGDNDPSDNLGTDEPQSNVTPLPVSPPAFDTETIWGDLSTAYLDRNWSRTLDQLIALFRIDPEFNQQLADYEGLQTQLAYDLLLDDPDDPFWQENAELFDFSIVETMFFDAIVGLAAEANASRQVGKALDYLTEALILRPTDEGIIALALATNAVDDAAPLAVPDARILLRDTYVEYATAMANRGDLCSAAEHLQTAQNLQANLALNATLSQYQDSCAQDIDVQESEPILAQLSGWLLYSAEGREGDQILLTRAGSDGSSVTVLEGATLPSLSPNRERLSFFSTDDDQPGLFAINVGSAFPSTLPAQDDFGLRLTNFFEDGAEGPLAWGPDSDRIAFGSLRESDRLPRVYAGWSGDSDSSRFISAGTDPAWRPGQEVIVHNGVDETANRPGLWLRDSDGSVIERLTDVREDVRPTWSPDGTQIVFTSNGRDDNWELYRLDLETAAITSLTDNPALDVAPTVSPDGNYVAFFSDRGGQWAIWATDIDGDRVWRLASVAGTIDNWRNHSLQWVE